MMARSSSSSRGGHFILFSMAVMLGPLFFTANGSTLPQKERCVPEEEEGEKKAQACCLRP